MKPVVVVLAAGASERLGECKALVDLEGRTALERLSTAAVAGGAQEICVVVGAHAAAMERELGGLAASIGVRALQHREWASGRTGSLDLAARSLPGRDLLVAPIDVPLVPPSVFEQLFLAWSRAGAPPRGWLAPFVGPGRRFGHPLILGRQLAEGLARLPPDQPLKTCRAMADPVGSVEVFHPEILDDLDTPADLERLRARLRQAR